MSAPSTAGTDPGALTQAAYQVRLEWGSEGLRRLAPADVVVLVDVLGGTDADPLGAALAADLVAAVRDVAAGDPSSSPLLLGGSLRSASAVAQAVLCLQHANGRRTSVAVIAVGEVTGSAGLRPAVEDQLGAGAVVAALSERGIDHCSPEAAVAAEGFRALRGAVRHLLSASGSGRDLTARGRGDDVPRAAEIDADDAVAQFSSEDGKRLS